MRNIGRLKQVYSKGCVPFRELCMYIMGIQQLGCLQVYWSFECKDNSFVMYYSSYHVGSCSPAIFSFHVQRLGCFTKALVPCIFMPFCINLPDGKWNFQQKWKQNQQVLEIWNNTENVGSTQQSSSICGKGNTINCSVPWHFSELSKWGNKISVAEKVGERQVEPRKYLWEGESKWVNMVEKKPKVLE